MAPQRGKEIFYFSWENTTFSTESEVKWKAQNQGKGLSGLVLQRK